MTKIEAPNGIVMDGSIIQHNNKVLLPDTSWGKWFGDIVAVIPETPSDKLRLDWTGSQIPIHLFRQIISFFKWTYDEYNCESQVRLYYNPQKDAWKAIAMPQFITKGLSSDEDDSDDEFNKLKLKMDEEGYGHAGSGHHHCGAVAFQSATDFKDEIGTEGFHFTVGNMDGDKGSFHCRCVVRKVNYDNVGKEDFVPYVDDQVSLSLKNLPEFPEEWRGRMKKKPMIVSTGKYSGNWWSTWKNRSSVQMGNRYNRSPYPITPVPATSYEIGNIYDDYLQDYRSYHSKFTYDGEFSESYYDSDDLMVDRMVKMVALRSELDKEDLDTVESILEAIVYSVGLDKANVEVMDALANLMYEFGLEDDMEMT